MRAVLSRVSRASITINGEAGGSIEKGFLVLLGIGSEDKESDAVYLAKKCAEMRIFEDENEKMNLGLSDVGGGMMVVSNFTLYGECAKGRRPDFFSAARPNTAIPLYELFLSELKKYGITPVTGKFGADMQIDHVNDGPVTLILDTERMLKK
ncbi:MAG: D-tyrosyl-tRNA(Tyr) deacylase [Clostridia bacterium]|nr:D-tyrosyl-tRNA(Tyr) deacylase [Clostridia bacterium]MBR4955165.1 D-tyrosyl-tRNA(Tyr) deacylase [Clostridia bacterium]